MKVSSAEVTAQVATQVAALPTMDRAALLALWSEALGGAPPRSMSQPFLRRLLAWELQARAQGGLSAAVRRKLDALAATPAGGKPGRTATTTAPKLKAGGRLLREWAGVTHVVDVVEGGYLWKGTRHRSLSAIARAITGAHWSGPRFFGLKEAAKGGAAARAGTGGAKAGKRAAAGTERPAGPDAATRATTATRSRTTPPALPSAPMQGAARPALVPAADQPGSGEVAA